MKFREPCGESGLAVRYWQSPSEDQIFGGGGSSGSGTFCLGAGTSTLSDGNSGVDADGKGAAEGSVGRGAGRGTGLIIGTSGPTGLVGVDEAGRPIVGNTRGVIVVFPGPLRNGVRLSGGRAGIEAGSGLARWGGGTTCVTGRT